ncbi:MAG: M3 family oligoendopeptidase [Anaerolineales bacterium]|jgi:oligoendopeptidase F
MAETTYKQQAWSLDDLFPGHDAPELKAAVEEVRKRAAAFEVFRNDLKPDISEAKFLEILASYESLSRLISRVWGFGQLLFAQDTQDQHAQSLVGRVQQLYAEADNSIMFFRLWWKALDDDAADRLMAAAEDYRYWLEVLRLHKPYTLSEPEERIINLKDVNGFAALVNVYTSITNRYVFHLEVDGEDKELTRGELMVYVRSQDPEVRAAAYQALYKVYEADAPILGQIYQYLLRDWSSENVDLRKMKSPIAARNLDNNVPDEVVDLLLDVCEENAVLFQRYFQLKAKILGVDRLRRYDIYAPVTQYEKSYSFEKGVEASLESFRGFDPRIADLAAKVIEEDHLDSEVRKGKMGGAFCATVEPDLTPWVLTSYQGQPDDVATLAHELGHAVHALLADHHNALTQHSSLPMAETASTFAEMLLVDHMIAEDPDPELRKLLLFRQMDDAYATIMRQAFFAIFERVAHNMVQQGASADELSEAYLENLKLQFGDSLELTEDFRHEWVAIPHFYNTPFYVYAYTFGQLLVLSLYQQFLNEGESFIPGYIEILSAGGSDSPESILKRAGIDFTKRAFWQGGFDVLAASLDTLEALVSAT